MHLIYFKLFNEPISVKQKNESKLVIKTVSLYDAKRKAVKLRLKSRLKNFYLK